MSVDYATDKSSPSSFTNVILNPFIIFSFSSLASYYTHITYRVIERETYNSKAQVFKAFSSIKTQKQREMGHPSDKLNAAALVNSGCYGSLRFK
ncbi:hypothetical protein HanXRQr2_Chr13g0604901 [Helianthus annuus]|uniref:Uncharacterized protein n=1 Tax=Helianthus annuus TaxID=4232 RepID=A0A9K3EKR9_HELAN|nr:hypothetical protein HanXRQr2_Chr13g0604901 [Helianthus annuus]KAJ0850619.1 hypothetical protein HanPSC8_Chr13g0582911 [Helianthus annuus]